MLGPLKRRRRAVRVAGLAGTRLESLDVGRDPRRRTVSDHTRCASPTQSGMSLGMADLGVGDIVPSEETRIPRQLSYYSSLFNCC